MRKLLFILLFFSFILVVPIYAENNITSNIYELSDSQQGISSENPNNSHDNVNNEKYYWKNNITNQEYYFFKNGSVCKIYNSDSNNLTYKMYDNILNKEQIDFYLENGYFSYALAYMRAHENENLTYDEVINEEVEGIIDAAGWIFYNNGTVKCDPNYGLKLYYNGTVITYEHCSKFYMTTIFGTAIWDTTPVSKGSIFIEYLNHSSGFTNLLVPDIAHRFPNGKFSDFVLSGTKHYDMDEFYPELYNYQISSSNNQSNNNTTINNISMLMNNNTSSNNDSILMKDNISTNNTITIIMDNNTSVNNPNNENLDKYLMENTTSNPLILLIIGLLILMGVCKKRNL